MNRVTLLLALIGVAVAGLVVLGAWYLVSYQHGGSVSGMMGQMMGSGYVNGMAAMPAAVWVVFLALIVAVIAGVAGVAYFAAFPEIKTQVVEPVTQGNETKADGGLSWSALLRTSKPEERKVLEVLAAHDGRYLQKFVVKETGLSRLKTHRIVSRFAERGVITVDRKGNTNEIALSPWLQRESSPTATAA